MVLRFANWRNFGRDGTDVPWQIGAVLSIAPAHIQLYCSQNSLLVKVFQFK
jgi:hypothetical protein